MEHPILLRLAPGLWDGLVHPVLGIDHLFAMVCVGVVSTLIGGRAIWKVPATFVFAMAIGGIAGLNDWALHRSEVLIAGSLIALGLAMATNCKNPFTSGPIPGWVVGSFVVIFGTAHGNAHGLEIPSAASPVAFTAGFLLGTAGLHLAGVSAGLASAKLAWAEHSMRMAGFFTAALGIGLLAR